MRDAAAFVPAIAALIALLASGGVALATAAQGIILVLSVLTTGVLLRGFDYPLRLMPLSRLIVAQLPALAGLLAAALLSASGQPDSGALFAAAAIALVAAAMVQIAERVLLARRPLRIAILGSPTFAAGLRREIEAAGGETIDVIGWLNIGSRAERASGKLSEGTLDSIRAAVNEHEIDLLVRAIAPSEGVSRDSYAAIAESCLDLPVRIIDGNQLYEELFGHVPLGTIGAEWFSYIMHPRFESTAPAAKRAFDLVGATLVSIVALPLIGLAAIGIKLTDGGAVFYRQRRVGEGGAEYEILKLRTMTEDAESAGAQWSVAADTRVTPIGRLLRRTHVDELPQILNVFRGDMTLVGPRPERPEMIAELERVFPRYKRRLLVKPGVTGWAQVRCGYAGSELGTGWKLCHDLYYLKHRSVLADLLIMVETLAIAAKDSHRELRAPQPEFIFDPETIEGIAADRRSIEQESAREAAVPEPGLEAVDDPEPAETGPNGANGSKRSNGSLRSRLLGQIAG